MKSKLARISIVLVFLASSLSACSSAASSAPQPTSTTEWQAGLPREGQPAFPKLGQYWVVDEGCNFNREKVRTADAMFEKLRTDGIAEVAIVCQKGIVDNGATNNEKIWLRDWARWAKIGDVEDDRAVVWLIRPDAQAEGQVVTVEVSRWLFWYTAIDYADTINEAANYANQKDFDGALVAIARNTNEKLRQLWERQPH